MHLHFPELVKSINLPAISCSFNCTACGTIFKAARGMEESLIFNIGTLKVMLQITNQNVRISVATYRFVTFGAKKFFTPCEIIINYFFE